MGTTFEDGYDSPGVRYGWENTGDPDKVAHLNKPMTIDRILSEFGHEDTNAACLGWALSYMEFARSYAVQEKLPHSGLDKNMALIRAVRDAMPPEDRG